MCYYDITMKYETGEAKHMRPVLNIWGDHS